MPAPASVQYPWRDIFGDGKWLRQAYYPSRNDNPQPTDELLERKNLELAHALTADGEASVKQGLCSGRGIYTHVMPWYKNGNRLGRWCHCFPGWYGDNCEIGPGSPDSPISKTFCVHDCSGRGVCKLNWCHCVPGTWGIDCGFGDPDGEAADTAELEQRRLGLGRPYGWTTAMRRTPSPLASLPRPSKGLRIYVYSLPPRFNVWLAAHFRRSGRWDQSYLYSLDAKMHRWLLRSPYRTLDPTEANYFFVPGAHRRMRGYRGRQPCHRHAMCPEARLPAELGAVRAPPACAAYLSLGFYDYEFGLYWLSGRGHVFLRQVFDYVKMTHPWYNASGGADHLLVMTNDKGATFIRGSVPAMRKVNLITQWGWVRDHIHHRGVDIVVPPMLKVGKHTRMPLPIRHAPCACAPCPMHAPRTVAMRMHTSQCSRSTS